MVFVKLLKDISTKFLQNKINKYIQHIPENDIISISINSFNNDEYNATVVTYNEQPRELAEYKPPLVGKGNKRKTKFKQYRSNKISNLH
jgi:hypothetical protein